MKEDAKRTTLFILLSFGGIYLIYGKKYINLSLLLLLGFSSGIAKSIILALQKDNAGGTTPHNPLKIPGKKIIQPI